MGKFVDEKFVKEMKLSKSELDSFEKMINIAEKANKNTRDFIETNEYKAFTPVAALAVSVVNLTFNLFGNVAAPNEDLQHNLKIAIKKFNELESSVDDEPGLDFYSDLRKKIIEAKKK
ncbi:MAG: hypothetical protein ACI87N_003542 [Flavobacteriales bacterium]|jgi:hypothetical protein